VVVGLAAGSAAIGAARGQEDALQATGTLQGVTALPAPAAGSTSPSATPSATPSGTPSATPSASTSSAKPATTSARPKASWTTSSKVPTRGDGTLHPVLVPGSDSAGGGRVVRYAFEVEGGLAIDRASAAKIVGAALRDPRGWQQVDGVRFVQVTPQQRAKGTKPDVTISLVSPAKTDAMCAPLQTKGTWSCANKDHAVLNYRRWAQGTPSYAGKSLGDYRSYVVNHEVGHELGHPHVTCGGKGKLAAVMMQQSKGLDGCKVNVWPKITRG
jgi:Protein of unknown function (DUF3152)